MRVADEDQERNITCANGSTHNSESYGGSIQIYANNTKLTLWCQEGALLEESDWRCRESLGEPG
jgi:hypothetical protein